ncbi:MAG: hypothetical protein RMJ51_05245 [Candidatus Calescibacterium sp.]|nr:hypothetical protein [Candidatus Calescibacterium sp.]MCX7972482.1 hypothetical protein [bacterium]MDW8195626.1 hypothetical protein [Candidatus Calescibacterium sp.]
MLEISNKKVITLDTQVKHSDKCKCKACRLKITIPKSKLLLPTEIKRYLPVFTVNPSVSFIFISKLFEAINSKYLDISFDSSSIKLDDQIQELLDDNFSTYFRNFLDFIVNKDIFNAVGFFEENVDKFSEFELFYISGLINFYLQNLDKSYDSFLKAFETLFGKTIDDPLEDIEFQYVDLFFLFDLMIVSLYFKKYDTFEKIFEFLIKMNNDFSLYTFMMYMFLFFYVYDSYIVLENIMTVVENMDNIVKIINEFSNPNIIKAYILYILVTISIYRQELYNVLKNELNTILQYMGKNLSSVENHLDVINQCVKLDNDNILYKIVLHSIDKSLYKDFVSSLEFLPMNKTISNFIRYVKLLEIGISKLILEDIGLGLNFAGLKDLVESEPNNPFFWFINGLYNFVNRDFNIANNYFRGTVVTDNSFTEARIFFATTLFLTGEIEKSLKILENSINTPNGYLFDIVLINMSIIQKILKKEFPTESVYNQLLNLESVEILQNLLGEVES